VAVEELIARFAGDLIGRVGGPMSVRFILQPAIATFLAVRAGLKDAREGRPAYFWTILSNPAHRRDLLRNGWKDVAKVFVMAVVLDTVYQIIQLRWIHPLQALTVAVTLALLPYLLFRGPVRRIAGWWTDRASMRARTSP
jgi:hypothetical protein